jgi:hypothetical protein
MKPRPSKDPFEQFAQRCRELGLEMPEMDDGEEAELLVKAQKIFEALQAEINSPRLAPK